MKAISTIVFSLLLSISPLFSQSESGIPVPSGYNEARELYRSGHSEFINGRYDEAIELYDAVDRFIEGHPSYARFFDHAFRGFSMVDMVKRHRDLGPIKPSAIHRILVLYIDRTDAPYGNGRIASRFTDSLKETERLSREVCKRFVEVLSEGRLTLAFDELHLDAAITEIEAVSSGDMRLPADRLIESIQPYPGELFLKNFDSYDSFLFYWNHKNENGDIIYTGNHGWGGVERIPLIPYQLSGPPRGRIVISAGLLNRPGTLLHELFHTFEKSYDIRPIHGFRDNLRSKFPEWRGTGELDYYEYHISSADEKEGLERFKLAERYPNPVSGDFFRTETARISALTAKERKQAQQQYFEARSRENTDSDESLLLLHRAEELNPFYPPALLHLTIMYHMRGDKAAALEYAERAYNSDPFDPEICYWIGVEHFHTGEYGKSVGYLTEALQLNPSLIKAQNYRDFVYEKWER